jgi:hypothetical protein
LLNETNNSKRVEIQPQPNDVTCGPTCLQAVYHYYEDQIDLKSVIREVRQFKEGGTLAVMLGNHALDRGYDATIYTYNLQVFDPTWFRSEISISKKLEEQRTFKMSKKLNQATDAYLRFISGGGLLEFQELSPELIRGILINRTPILTGLSATYLYNCSREIPEYNVYHDTKGEPVGHFVVITEYDRKNRRVGIADPLNPNPINDSIQYYAVDIQRLINSILLGIVTYDANLLVIQPRRAS